MAEDAATPAPPSPDGWRGASRSWMEAHPWAVTLAIFVVALGPRLFVAATMAHEPVWDGHYYHYGAQRIAAGQGYSDAGADGASWHPWCHYPVGYSGFLAGFYAIFGDSPTVAVIVQAFVLSVSAAAVHRIALHFLSPMRAVVGGLLAALHPVLILYAALVMTEPLAALGLLLAPLAYLRLERRPLLAAIAGGAVLGLTTLVRPQTLLMAPALALLARGSPPVRRVAVAVVATLSCIVVVLPWSLRNCAQMDGCAFVSTNAGWNLAIGSSPHATGRFSALSPKDGCTIVTGQVQQDRCWADQGARWIREDPARWVGLAPDKLAYTFDHQSFAVGYLEQADPSAWPEARRTWWRSVLGASQYGLLFLAALGVGFVPRGRMRDVGLAFGQALAITLLVDGVVRSPAQIWPLASLIPVLGLVPPFGRASRGLVSYLGWSVATLIVTHAVFFGEDRYQVVITPALCVLAAGAGRWSPEEEALTKP